MRFFISIVYACLLSGACLANDAELTRKLINCTTRISIQDPDHGHSVGSGTIIDRLAGEALILSCAHILKASDTKGPIIVETFVCINGKAEMEDAFRGYLVAHDFEKDVSLISIKDPKGTKFLDVYPNEHPAVGTEAISCGCSLSRNPTVLFGEVRHINRYQGPENIEVSSAPAEGRSGGGVFDRQGRLFGVCYAADHECNEGLYSGPANIYYILGKVNLPKGKVNERLPSTAK